MPETLTLRQSPSKMRWVVVGSLVFVAIGLWMIIHPEGSRRSPEFVRFMGFVSVIFFGWAGFAGVRSLSKPTELVLSAEGFRVLGIRPTAVTPWSAVERFFITKVHRAKFVSYDFTSAEKLKRHGAAALLPTLGVIRNQLPSQLEQSPDELCDLMEAWRRQHGMG